MNFCTNCGHTGGHPLCVKCAGVLSLNCFEMEPRDGERVFRVVGTHDMFAALNHHKIPRIGAVVTSNRFSYIVKQKRVVPISENECNVFVAYDKTR